MRMEISLPSPHGHQLPKIKASRFGSEVKSNCPGQSPPKLLSIARTISGALPTFALSQVAPRQRSKMARTLSFLSTLNSARTVSKRRSHFQEKIPWNALANSLETFSMCSSFKSVTIPLSLCGIPLSKLIFDSFFTFYFCLLTFLLPRIARPIDYFSRSRASVMTIIDDYRAIDQHVVDPLGILLGIFVCCRVRDGIRIEYNHVAPISFAQQAAIFQTQHLRRHRSHLAHRVFEREDFFLARVLAEHARIGAEAPRMRLAGIF